MKFTARAADLREAIERATKVVPKNPSQAVYAGVRLRVRGGDLTVTGSDEGETTVIVTVPVTDAAPGDKVLLPKPLEMFLATLAPSTSVTVTAGAGPELCVHPAGASPYTFPGMEVTFPNTAAPAAQLFDADLSLLALAVKAVKDSAAVNKIVQVTACAEGLRLHATDGRMLARATLPGVDLGSFTGLLPFAVLERIGEVSATTVALDKRGRVFTASNDTVTIIARQVESPFPNVNSILDDPPPFTAHIPVRRVLQALTRLSAVSGERPVVISIAGDQLTLTTKSESVGAGREQVDLDMPSPSEITFGANVKFFRSALAAHPAGDVTLGWSSPERQFFLTSAGDVPITTVVMPVKF